MGAKIESIHEETLERLKDGISRIKVIEYFRPERSLKEAYHLVRKVDEIIDDCINALEPWKKEATSWKVALDVASDAAWKKVWDTKRYTLSHIVWSRVYDEVLHKAMNAAPYAPIDVAFATAWYVSNYLTWEIVRDLPGFVDNPFDYVIRLYKMGLKPVGFKKVDGIERFVVDFPLIKDGKNILGCYAHKDGKILWVHEWKDYCTNLKSLKPRVRIIK